MSPNTPTRPAPAGRAQGAVEKVNANAHADYYRVQAGERAVSVRVSVRYPVPPLCLTCIRFDCEHAEAVAEYLEATRAAA